MFEAAGVVISTVIVVSGAALIAGIMWEEYKEWKKRPFRRIRF